ncbi:MAG: hypothetical protein ACRC1H_12815, partial [Caldilineaceae bacterium]
MIRSTQQRQRAVRLQDVMVALAVLLAAPVIGFAMARLGLGVMPLAFALGLFGLVLIGRSATPIHAGILLMIVAAMVLGFFTLPTGRESRLVISLVVALGLLAAWLVSMLVIDHRIALKPSPVNAPLLAFVAVNLVSYGWSLVMRDELLFVWASFRFVQVAALLVNIALPLVLLLVANFYHDELWVRRLVNLFLLLSFVAALLQWVSPSTHTIFFARGTRGLWPMWSSVLAYALALFGNHLKPWQRAALLGFVALQVYTHFFEGRLWVSGWLPLGVACAIVTLLRSRRLFLVVLVVGSLYVAVNYT